LLGIFWNNPALLGFIAPTGTFVDEGGGLVGCTRGKNPPAGKALFQEEERGEGGERNKKLFHVISEEIFKFVRPQGFLKRGEGGALDSHSPPA